MGNEGFLRMAHKGTSTKLKCKLPGCSDGVNAIGAVGSARFEVSRMGMLPPVTAIRAVPADRPVKSFSLCTSSQMLTLWFPGEVNLAKTEAPTSRKQALS